jgi:hypothetical protein
LRENFSRRRKHLDAVILAVADIQLVLGIGCDEMHQRKLARTGAGLAPGVLQLARGREAVHAAIAIPVRDEKFATRGEGDTGGHIERAAVQRRHRHATDAQRAQQRAVRFVLRHGVHASVSDPHLSGGIDRQAMHEAGEFALAP